jgi:hypothetical protein
LIFDLKTGQPMGRAAVQSKINNQQIKNKFGCQLSGVATDGSPAIVWSRASGDGAPETLATGDTVPPGTQLITDKRWIRTWQICSSWKIQS